jgi:hypothetical protein
MKPNAVQNPRHFIGYSLVDITATGVKRSSVADDIRRNQQRNWETVQQVIGLRTQANVLEEPQSFEVDLEDMEFGEFYEGRHRVWVWVWSVDHVGIYDLPNETMGGLNQDFEQVPVITYLEDTARFMLPIFHTVGTLKNVYFKPVSDAINSN